MPVWRHRLPVWRARVPPVLPVFVLHDQSVEGQRPGLWPWHLPLWLQGKKPNIVLLLPFWFQGKFPIRVLLKQFSFGHSRTVSILKDTDLVIGPLFQVQGHEVRFWVTSVKVTQDSPLAPFLDLETDARIRSDANNEKLVRLHKPHSKISPLSL